MIDTITLHYPLELIGETKEQIVSRLGPFANKQWGIGEAKTTLILNNFGITIFDSHIFIRGSLCKYYYGDNLQTLKYKDVLKAIIRLKCDTGLPVHLFNISRIDVSDNIFTNYPVTQYLRIIEGIDRFEEEHYSSKGVFTGKYFHQSSKTVLLYDKYEECKYRKRAFDKKNFNNGIFKHINSNTDVDPKLTEYFVQNSKKVFRYEFRLRRNLKKQLALSELQLRDLARRSVFKKLVRIWVKNFLRLQTNCKVNKLPENVTSARMLLDLLLRAGVEYMGGYFLVLKMIRQHRKAGIITSVQQTRLIKKLKNVMSSIRLEECDSINDFQEVKSKILEAALSHLR